MTDDETPSDSDYERNRIRESGWTKPVAPPEDEVRPAGLPPKPQPPAPADDDE